MQTDVDESKIRLSSGRVYYDGQFMGRIYREQAIGNPLYGYTTDSGGLYYSRMTAAIAQVRSRMRQDH